MSKTDIKSAFRIMPIHPKNYHLLDITWEGQFYFDKCLPMGASSSCHLFERFSTALEFIGKKSGIHHIIHYLDDFLLLNESEENSSKDLNLFLDICRNINVPIAPEKTVLPTQIIQFLGLEIDSVNQEIRLPLDKV